MAPKGRPSTVKNEEPKRKPGRPAGTYTKKQNNTQDNRERSFALAYAKDIHVALINSGKDVPIRGLFDLADLMLGWLENAEITVPESAKEPEPEKKTTKKTAPKKAAPKPEEKKEDTIYGFGQPEGDIKIANDTVEKVIKAFGRFDVSTSDLKAKSGLPVEDWTPNIKKTALNMFNDLKAGKITKEDLLS